MIKYDRPDSPSPRLQRQAIHIVCSWLGIGLVTVVCYRTGLRIEVPSLLYLLVIVLQSLSGGYFSLAIVSVTAVACLDYFFIPPVLEWQISDPKDTFALFTYLVTSLAITHLAGKARKEAMRAESKRKEVTLLYETASQLLSLEAKNAAGTLALRIFRDTFGLNAACLFDPGTSESLVVGDSAHGLSAATLSASAANSDYRSHDGWIHVRCFRSGGRTVGALGLEGHFDDDAVLSPLFAIACTAFERARSFREASKAAAAAQAEMLRSVVLDALAHEFKTPQAVIMTAAGTLRETGGLREEQLRMTDLIEAQVCRMSRITTGFLRMARLDRDGLKPNLEVTGLDELVTQLIGQYRNQCGDHTVSIKVERPAQDVLTDPELIRLALVQLLDNACKYSRPGSEVAVKLQGTGEFADLFVSNSGHSIPPEEEERIFERSYRGAETEHSVPGTGLGLYVARKIIRAHGGDLKICGGNTVDGTTTFRIRLPLAQTAGTR